MVKKSTLKKNVDRKQDARIRRLERLNPMVDEIIHSHSTVSTPPQNAWALYAPYPAALQTEKVILRGISCRTIQQIVAGSAGGDTGRVVLLLYKSDVDYSQVPPVVTPPSATDIFVAHGQLTYGS